MANRSGIDNCCIDRTLRLGMSPVAYKPLWTYEDGIYGGFMVDVLTALQTTMGFNIEIIDMPVEDNPTYSLRRMVNRTVDIVPVAAISEILDAYGEDEVVFTYTSFKDTKWSGLVKRTWTGSSMFRLFDPFTPGLWASIAATIIIAAILLYVIDRVIPYKHGITHQKMTAGHGRQIMWSFYHVLALFLQGKEYEWATLSARVLRTALLFAVLVLGATCAYTRIS